MSSHNLTLRVPQGNGPGQAVDEYRCLLEPMQGSSIHIVHRGKAKALTGLLPDTEYTIGCVGYDEEGQDLCVEANTTVITGE